MYQPGFERAWNRTGQMAPLPYPIDQVGAAAGYVPGHDVGVTVHGFGVRGHHEIRPQIQGALAEWGNSRVVGYENRPGLLRLRSQLFDVDQVEARIGRSLDPHQLDPINFVIFDSQRRDGLDLDSERD